MKIDLVQRKTVENNSGVEVYVMRILNARADRAWIPMSIPVRGRFNSRGLPGLCQSLSAKSLYH
jgi:hypothetical protein